MKFKHASLTDQQVRDTFFLVPEFGNVYALALGAEGYQSFKAQRQNIRVSGGELLMIGWPDGMTITYSADDPTLDINLVTLVETYRAGAVLFRIRNQAVAK